MKEIPAVESVNREVDVWDPAIAKWKRGRRGDLVIPRGVVEITWTATGVATDITPDNDKEIDITYAKTIAIQIDTTHADNTSTDFDVNVESLVEGGVWDTSPYAERNIGNAAIKTFLVEPGPVKIRLRGDNNASATTGYVTARVFVIE